MATITSILDTDLYKLTMQQAVLHQFPDAVAEFRFTNRSKNMTFTTKCVEDLKAAVAKLAELKVTPEELEWLKKTCPYFTEDYLAYLAKYRFKPEQVSITFAPTDVDPSKGQILMKATGPWVETILWEIPLMSLLSETYFLVVDTFWEKDGQAEKAYEKGKKLIQAGCTFSEFGSRRRRSFQTQDIVVASLKRAHQDYASEPNAGKLFGTSNAHFAHKYDLTPIGTIAHEWFMGVAALKGYENASTKALTCWETVYTPEIGKNIYTSLTDTFSSAVFFKEIKQNPELFKRWKLRQDSGDPMVYIKEAKKLYEETGIDPMDKPIIFSDSLDIEKAIAIQNACEEAGLKAGFGVGTFLTNDFETADGSGQSKALNMVIKLYSVDNKPCVKISDDIGKNTGDPNEVLRVKQLYGIPSQ